MWKIDGFKMKITKLKFPIDRILYFGGLGILKPQRYGIALTKG